MKKILLSVCAIFIVLNLAGNVQATIMRLDWDMTITDAGENQLLYNAYGLAIGDSFSAFAVYDNTALTGIGEEFIYFDSSTNQMEINPPSIPTGTFNDTVATSPYIRLVDGAPVGVSYDAMVNGVTQENLSVAGTVGGTVDPIFYDVTVDLYISDIFSPYFVLTDRAGIRLEGEYGNFSVAPVPEPATLLLFGTGLIGLAGLGRKKIIKK